MPIIIWLLITIAMVFYAFGEFFSKQFANHREWIYAILALSAYCINAALFLPALSKYNKLALLGTIWNLGYVLTTLALSLLVFHETITIKQTIGIIFACIAVALLS